MTLQVFIVIVGYLGFSPGDRAIGKSSSVRGLFLALHPRVTPGNAHGVHLQCQDGHRVSCMISKSSVFMLGLSGPRILWFTEVLHVPRYLMPVAKFDL